MISKIKTILSSKPFRLVGRVAWVATLLLIVSNTLWPAVARAQFVAAGGASVAEILAALVGQTVTAERFVSSATTGTGYTCNAALSPCFDPGPGACNGYFTNGSGDIILGGTACVATIRWGDSNSFENNTWTNTNGFIRCNNGCVLNDPTNELDVVDPDGLDINNTTPVKGYFQVSVSVDLPDTTGHCDDVTATVTGVEANDRVRVHAPALADGLNFQVGGARVTNAATDEVTFRACDHADSSDDPASATFVFEWVRI